jgi:hypothetical protein
LRPHQTPRVRACSGTTVFTPTHTLLCIEFPCVASIDAHRITPGGPRCVHGAGLPPSPQLDATWCPRPGLHFLAGAASASRWLRCATFMQCCCAWRVHVQAIVHACFQQMGELLVSVIPCSLPRPCVAIFALSSPPWTWGLVRVSWLKCGSHLSHLPFARMCIHTRARLCGRYNSYDMTLVTRKG